MRPTTLALAATFAFTAPAAALAADLDVPARFPTIGDAVAAARSGDRIVVTGGRHAGVVVDRDGVTLEGRGATLLGNVTVSASNVTLRGFVIRGYSSCQTLLVTGDDVAVVANTFAAGRGHIALRIDGGRRPVIERNRSAEIYVTNGDGAVIRGNTTRTAGIGVESAGAIVESNRSRGVIWVAGDRAVIRGNHARNIGLSGGDDALIENNVVTRGGLLIGGDRAQIIGNGVANEGISVGGDDVVVRGNRVTRSAYALLLTGNNPDVSGNVFSAAARYSPRGQPHTVAVRIVTGSPGGTITGNRVTHTGMQGIKVTADGVTVSDNTVRGVTPATSIAIVGSGNTIAGNDVAHSGTPRPDADNDGILVIGDANAVSDNHVDAAAGNGIVIAEGEGNTVTSNVLGGAHLCGLVVYSAATDTVVTDVTVHGADVGFANTGVDTSLTDSTLTGNRRVDLIDGGGLSLFDGNTVRTVSHDPSIMWKR